MRSIKEKRQLVDIETLFTVVYMLVDDWVKQHPRQGPGRKAVFSDPIPVLSYKRNKGHSDFLGSANYGVCVSRKLKYFGYKLVLLCSLQGDSVYYDLVPANTDERDAAEQVFQRFEHLDILADKGFIGEAWQAEQTTQGIFVWTAKRENQAQNLAAFDAMIASYRQRIEGVFNELQNLGKNLERLFAKTVIGLCTRVTALIASHTLKTFLRRFYLLDLQTFSWLA